MLKGIFPVFLLLILARTTLAEHYYVINTHEGFIYAQPGDDVTLACLGPNGELRIGSDKYHDNSSNVINRTLTATSDDYKIPITCTTQNEIYNVTLIVNFLTLEGAHSYDVIVEEEQTVVVDYSANPDADLSVVKREEVIRNFYHIPDPSSKAKGRLVLHFLKLTESDLGPYHIYSSNSTVEITLRKVSAPVDLRLVFIYVSPALSLLICLIVIIVTVCCVRKRKCSANEKMTISYRKTSTKNEYARTSKVTSPSIRGNTIPSTSSQATLQPERIAERETPDSDDSWDDDDNNDVAAIDSSENSRERSQTSPLRPIKNVQQASGGSQANPTNGSRSAQLRHCATFVASNYKTKSAKKPEPDYENHIPMIIVRSNNFKNNSLRQ